MTLNIRHVASQLQPYERRNLIMSTTKVYTKSVFKSEGVKTSVVRFKEVKPMQLHIEVKEDGKVAINNHYHNGSEFTYSAENIVFTTDADNLAKFGKECIQASEILKKLIKVTKPVTDKTTVAGKAGTKDIEITPELEIALSAMLQKLGIPLPQTTPKKGVKKGK
jgi:hypothetical protein